MYENEVKRLRWLAFNFPHTDEPKSESDKICNCINLYCTEAADAIEELMRQLDTWVDQERKALIKSLPKWIPVTEQEPEEDKLVLVWRNNGLPYVSRRIDSSYWVGLGREAEVTHWMPLPTPPKEETE